MVHKSGKNMIHDVSEYFLKKTKNKHPVENVQCRQLTMITVSSHSWALIGTCFDI
jgi:hypothetical protein